MDVAPIELPSGSWLGVGSVGVVGGRGRRRGVDPKIRRKPFESKDKRYGNLSDAKDAKTFWIQRYKNLLNTNHKHKTMAASGGSGSR